MPYIAENIIDVERRQMEPEDIKLVRRAKENNEDYEALYNKYADAVYNYFWYRVGHQNDVAEDLMQETFLKAFNHLPKFQTRGYSYLTYLLTIAHNVLVNYNRTPRALPLEAVGDVPTEITDELERKSDAEVLWRAIQQLTDSEKDVLLMRYRRNMPIKDIARIMNKSENAVKLILSRTRKKLAKHPYLSDIRGFVDKKRAPTKAQFLKR